MDTLVFIGILLFGFGLLVFSMKLMAYNRAKYNIPSLLSGNSSEFGQLISRNTFRLLILILLIMVLIILYSQSIQS